jgi:uncharacterized protein (DUF362 family)
VNDTSVVVLARVASYDRATVGRALRRSLELLGSHLSLEGPVIAADAGIHGTPLPSGRSGPVLLKPNLLAPAAPEECATTHPVVFAETARALGERGYALAYGDSPGFGAGSRTRRSRWASRSPNSDTEPTCTARPRRCTGSSTSRAACWAPGHS